MTAPRPSLDDESLLRRQDTYLSDHYLAIYATIVSVAIGVATVAAGSLLATPEHESIFTHYRLLFGALWLAALLAVAVAYAGPMMGGILLPPILPGMIDLLTPSTLGICEFTLFSVLAYNVTGWSSPRSVLIAWWFAFVIFNLTALFGVARARRLVKRTTLTPSLDQIFYYYLRRLRSDIGGASVALILSVVGTAIAVVTKGILVNFIFAVAAIVLLSLGLANHARTVRGLREHLEAIRAARMAGGVEPDVSHRLKAAEP